MRRRQGTPIGGAAKLLSVGAKSVESARTVKEHGAPKLAQHVNAGDVTVSAAATVAKAIPKEQHASWSPGQVREVAAEIREDEKRNAHFRTSYTGNNEWHTPARYIQQARLAMGDIDLDPATSDIAQVTVKARRYFTKMDNGLAQAWHGRVWLNLLIRGICCRCSWKN